MTPERDPRELRRALDALAARAQRHLVRWSSNRDLRLTCRSALWWLPAGPGVLLVAQIAVVLTSRAAVPPGLWLWALFAVAGPVAFIAARMAWLGTQHRIDRRSSLGLFDSELDSKDRLVTADEFLAARLDANTPADQFKQAAIDDAAPCITTALATTLRPRALPDWHVAARSWWSVPATLAMVIAALWLGRISVGRDAASPATLLAGGTPGAVPAGNASTRLNPPPARPRFDRTAPDQKTDATDPATSSESSPRSIRSDQDTEGASHAGGQANSRSVSNAMSSSGTPSNQQMPSKPLEDDVLQDPQRASPNQAKKPELKKPEQQATSATSGQGQSKSSSSDTSKIPATDQPDRASADKDDGKDEGAVQDQAEEEKTSGVERPSLRKNKPPVDRNLSPRPAGDQPDPNANGRSGPGAQKKTRGVPAMILGIPTPDRIQGTSNPGRSKVTQEHSTPKEEPQPGLTAGERLARTRAFGTVDHPLLLPWMQTLIERYFTQIHKK